MTSQLFCRHPFPVGRNRKHECRFSLRRFSALVAKIVAMQSSFLEQFLADFEQLPAAVAVVEAVVAVAEYIAAVTGRKQSFFCKCICAF